MIPTIHSNDSWTTLREVWLGDVYPADFYDHLDPQVRDVFYQITEWTKEDLAILERKLQEFGIKVRRPEYHSIDNHLNEHEQLIRPSITPRDNYVVVGNTLYIPGYCLQGIDGFKFSDDFRFPWRKVVNEYHRDVDSKIKYHNTSLRMCSANMVRAGKDLYLDCNFVGPHATRSKREIFDQEIVPMFPNHRMHYLENGGHLDACFAILKPGYILANRYFDDYETSFPGWEVIMLDDPEFREHKPPNTGDTSFYDPMVNWWVPGVTGSKAFNQHVIKYAQDWVGNYRETFFEVNSLMVDEKNVIMTGEFPAVEQKLSSIGITVHSVPFRCRSFWDAGLHCLTLDVRREGPVVDLFPERG